jgi:hypothetical protein
MSQPAATDGSKKTVSLAAQPTQPTEIYNLPVTLYQEHPAYLPRRIYSQVSRATHSRTFHAEIHIYYSGQDAWAK